MNLRYTLFIVVLLTIMSCSKEDEDDPTMQFSPFSEEKFIGKILPDTEGCWLLTRTIEDKNCPYCSSIDFIDGIAYFTNEKSTSKDAIGYILDAELKDGNLLTITNTEILKFNKNIESSVVKKAGSNETFKLISKDKSDKVWILSNKSVFTLEGESYPFKNNISAIDFEATKDTSFWMATADTVYHLKKSVLSKYCLADITGKRSSTSTIYSLKVGANDSIWVNTSDKIFKYKENTWREIKAGDFVSDNFKTLPFMDVDATGRLWLAEKNYQAFTDIRSFNGNDWTSYKLNPPLETWITDIEAGEPGSIWIGTITGLRKLKIN